MRQKEYERAIEAFDQALASNTTMIRQSDALLYTYQDKAFALIQLNNYTAAIQTLDQGLSLYENDEKLWYNKGYALFKLGKYQDALDAYDKCSRINNASQPALNNKGDTLFQMGRYQDAVDSYTRANAIEPNDSYSIAGLAKAQSAAAGAMQNDDGHRHHHPGNCSRGLVYFVKFRTPADKKSAGKKSKERKNNFLFVFICSHGKSCRSPGKHCLFIVVNKYFTFRECNPPPLPDYPPFCNNKTFLYPLDETGRFRDGCNSFGF